MGLSGSRGEVVGSLMSVPWNFVIAVLWRYSARGRNSTELGWFSRNGVRSKGMSEFAR